MRYLLLALTLAAVWGWVSRPPANRYQAFTWACDLHGGNHTVWTPAGWWTHPPHCRVGYPGPGPCVVDLEPGRNVTLPAVAVNGTVITLVAEASSAVHFRGDALDFGGVPGALQTRGYEEPVRTAEMNLGYPEPGKTVTLFAPSGGLIVKASEGRAWWCVQDQQAYLVPGGESATFTADSRHGLKWLRLGGGR